MIVVFGRGRSGTRVLAQILRDSGIAFPGELNSSLDLVPADELYHCCRIFGRYVGGKPGEWDFTPTARSQLDPVFIRGMDRYLAPIRGSSFPTVAWKLPEATLVFPWLTRLYPHASYVYLVRDPRTALSGPHNTDNLGLYGIRQPLLGADIYDLRAYSWIYQYRIVKEAPKPRRFLQIRFEDIVSDQATVRGLLENFLGIKVGTWSIDEERMRRLPAVSFSDTVAPLLAEPLLELGYGS